MSLIDIILLAIALGIDCLIVSFSQGLVFNKNRTVNSLKLAFSMGFFQGFMPCIGYTGAEYIYDFFTMETSETDNKAYIEFWNI